MKVAITVLGVLLLALGLAGCGGASPAGETSPVVNATSGLGDPNGPAGQQFTVDISGPLALRLADPAFAARFVQVESAGLPAHQLAFEDPEAKVTVMLVFLGTATPAAGTYPITGGAEENAVYGLVVDRRGDLPGSYTTQLEAGTITLTQEGATYGGSFEFKASGGMQDADPNSFLTATPVFLDIAVKGTFAGVVLE
jgi:hypothetical protein